MASPRLACRFSALRWADSGYMFCVHGGFKKNLSHFLSVLNLGTGQYLYKPLVLAVLRGTRRLWEEFCTCAMWRSFRALDISARLSSLAVSPRRLLAELHTFSVLIRSSVVLFARVVHACKSEIIPTSRSYITVTCFAV